MISPSSAHPGFERRTRIFSEAHLPAKCPQTGQKPWVPQAHVHQGWAKRYQVSPSPRKGEAVRLIWRIQHRAAFARLRAAKPHHGRHISLRWMADDDARPDLGRSRINAGTVADTDRPHVGSYTDRPHVGYAIGKHVGNAPVRNRIRRRIHAILHDLARDGELPGGLYLMTAKQSAATVTSSVLRSDLERQLRRVHAANKPDVAPDARETTTESANQ